MKISEVKGALTLEQLNQMHGQRILVPETTTCDGGFCVVDTNDQRVFFTDGSGWIEFYNYGCDWVAVADPFGVLEGGK